MATIKKVKKAQNGESITKKGSNYVYTTKSNRPEGSRYYQGESPDYSTARKIAKFNSQYRPSDSTRKASLSADQLKDLDKQKNGGKTMLKRKDGSTSQRGLWDNIRAAAKRNKAAGKPGKKPTAAMLKQEKKIKAKGK